MRLRNITTNVNDQGYRFTSCTVFGCILCRSEETIFRWRKKKDCARMKKFEKLPCVSIRSWQWLLHESLMFSEPSRSLKSVIYRIGKLIANIVPQRFAGISLSMCRSNPETLPWNCISSMYGMEMKQKVRFCNTVHQNRSYRFWSNFELKRDDPSVFQMIRSLLLIYKYVRNMMNLLFVEIWRNPRWFTYDSLIFKYIL